MKLLNGDCIEEMAKLEENSVDAIVTDPPYELGFMGKAWDSSMISFNPDTWRQALRILKPGGHLLAAGIGRTHHRLMCAIEDAGFEIRDCVYHAFGSGFPKSLDVSKAIDKAAGAERDIIYRGDEPGREGRKVKKKMPQPEDWGKDSREPDDYVVTAPATPEAVKWNGWGTALKPSIEVWALARKPLSEKTVAQNVLRWGTGALNIDGCRIATKDDISGINRQMGANFSDDAYEWPGAITPSHLQGRWPSHFILSHHEECNGICHPDCPVRMLDEQSGELKGPWGKESESANCTSWFSGRTNSYGGLYRDTGAAARFFYCAKSSRAERNLGLPKGMVSGHPTVKPLKLMAYLCRLITPPNGIILDCFMGSGATGCAAMQEGFGFIGIEKNPEYFEIAKHRIEYWQAQPRQDVLL